MRELTIQTKAGPVRVRRAAAGEVIDLRHRILRDGLPRDSAVFPGDDHPDAHHVVAILDGRVVGCVTIHPSTWDGAPAWQLRGMATDRALQGTGVGRVMLQLLDQLLLDRPDPVRQLWCNARVPAAGFYERLGWRVVSDPFDIPSAGPHVRMTKSLEGAGN
jgi:GNAT superfamily N-acetyltransferase